MQRQLLLQHFLSLVVACALIGATFWVLSPFFTAILWATMIVVAVWPWYRAMEARLGGRRWVAVLAAGTAMMLVFIVPFVLAVVTVIDHVDTITEFARGLRDFKLPPPPEFIARLPAIGPWLAQAWIDLRAQPEGLVARVGPYLGTAAQWLAGQAGTAGLLLLNLLLTIVVATVLFWRGEVAGGAIGAAARKLGGQGGEHLVEVAAGAIRAVAMGVMGTAIVQTLLAGIGLAVAGVPGAGLLTAVTFLLCVAQVGAGPVMIPAVLWLFWQDTTGWAIFLAAWTVLVVTIDNVVRPVLIRRGADLPLLLIFAGVIGGLLTMGLLGIFVGPTVLAVAYKLFHDWVGTEPTPSTGSAPDPARPDAGAS